MRQAENGFSLIEVIVVTAVVALIAGAASMTMFQVVKSTESSNDRMTAGNQVQNAGYWISRDAQMAESVTTDDLTPPYFLILKWTDWGYDEDSIYHSVVYSLEDVSGGIGKLKRTHQDSVGTDEQRLVAEYVYYNPSDPDNTTKASYESRVLTLKLVAVFGDAEETREYRIYRRPSFVSS